jgi:APA family basic amino acid/polyamine antiporter
MSEEKLKRGLGRWDFTAIVINTIIGAGIFGLPAKVFAQIGSYSLIAFAVCALIIGLIVLCYAEVSSRFSATGGPYLYAKEAFGPLVGFEVGWLYWVVRIATFAANCNLLVTYLGFFYPPASTGATRIVLIFAIVAVLAGVNLLGIRESAKMTNFVTAGKLIPLFVFGIAGLFFIHPANFTFDAVPGYSSFSSSMLLLIYAFVGFEAAVVLAGETRDPEKTVPVGSIVGLAIVAVIYILIQTVCIGTLPELASSERPLADAALNFLGSYGAAFITVGAAVSIYGNLNVGLLSSTRMLFAMAEQRALPPIFANTNARFKTPTVAVLVTSAVTLVLTIQSSFLTALTIATITRLLVYATTCLALPVFRRRSGVAAAPFTVPFGTVIAGLSILLIVWLLTNVDFTKEGLSIFVTAVIGLIIYGCFRLFGRSSEKSENDVENL